MSDSLYLGMKVGIDGDSYPAFDQPDLITKNVTDANRYLTELLGNENAMRVVYKYELDGDTYILSIAYLLKRSKLYKMHMAQRTTYTVYTFFDYGGEKGVEQITDSIAISA